MNTVLKLFDNEDEPMNFDEFKEKFEKVPVTLYSHDVNVQPLVSVCVQTYQHGDFIRECLDGILMQQTNFPFEILLGEDASTDGTREICIEYANKFPWKIRLFLHHRKNNIAIGGGPTGRFNFMYNLYSARGRYIALCEGDDYWTDALKLQKQVSYLESTPEASICLHNSIVVKNGIAIGEKRKTKRFTVYDTSHALKYKVLGPTASYLFRNVIELPNWFHSLYGGDAALLVLLSLQGQIHYMPDVMAAYRIHPTSIERSFESRPIVKAAWRIKQHKTYIDYDIVTMANKLISIRKILWNNTFRVLKSVQLMKFNSVIIDSLQIVKYSFMFLFYYIQVIASKGSKLLD